MPPMPVSAPWTGSMNDGWLWLSIRRATATPSTSTIPAPSPGPMSTFGPWEGRVRR